MNARNNKTRKLNDTEKFVCAVEKDDKTMQEYKKKLKNCVHINETKNNLEQ